MSLIDLPDEILEVILRASTLSRSDLYNLAQTSKTLYRLIIPIVIDSLQLYFSLAVDASKLSKLPGVLTRNTHLIPSVNNLTLKFEKDVPKQSIVAYIQILQTQGIQPIFLQIEREMMAFYNESDNCQSLRASIHLAELTSRLETLVLNADRPLLLPTLLQNASKLQSLSLFAGACKCHQVLSGIKTPELRYLSLMGLLHPEVASTLLNASCSTLEALRLGWEVFIPFEQPIKPLSRLRKLHVVQNVDKSFLRRICAKASNKITYLYLSCAHQDDGLWEDALCGLDKLFRKLETLEADISPQGYDENYHSFYPTVEHFVREGRNLKTILLRAWCPIDHEFVKNLPKSLQELKIAVETLETAFDVLQSIEESKLNRLRIVNIYVRSCDTESGISTYPHNKLTQYFEIDACHKLAKMEITIEYGLEVFVSRINGGGEV